MRGEKLIILLASRRRNHMVIKKMRRRNLWFSVRHERHLEVTTSSLKKKKSEKINFKSNNSSEVLKRSEILGQTTTPKTGDRQMQRITTYENRNP